MKNVKEYIFYFTDNSEYSQDIFKKIKEFSSEYLKTYILVNLEVTDLPQRISKKSSALIAIGNCQNVEESLKKYNLLVEDFSFRYHIKEDDEEAKTLTSFKRVPSRRIILEVISALSNLTPPYPDEIEQSYLPLKVTKIKNYKSYPCDLYLKVGQERYIKVFKKDENFDDRFSQYIAKGTDEFLVTTTDFYKIDHSALAELFNFEAFVKDPASSYKKQINIVYDVARDLGVKEIVFQQMEDTMSNFAKTLDDSKISSLLDEFNSLSGTFLFKHSYLISILCFAIVKKLDWGSDENLGKFGLAAMLHDMGFSKAEYASYEISESTATLPEEIKKELDSHTKVLSKQLADNESVHVDVIKMIKMHHYFDLFSDKEREIADGRLNHQACIFLMVHYFVVELYRSMFNKDKIPKILDEVEEKFNKGTFKSVSKIFRKEMSNALNVGSV